MARAYDSCFTLGRAILCSDLNQTSNVVVAGAYCSILDNVQSIFLLGW